MFTTKSKLIIVLLLLSLLVWFCGEDQYEKYGELIIGDWELYDILVNDEPLIMDEPEPISDTISFTTDGLIIYSDTVKYDYRLDRDLLFVLKETYVDTFKILQLDQQYLRTYRSRTFSFHDTSLLHNEEFFYRRLLE